MKSRLSKLCLVLFAMMLVSVSAWAQKTVTGTVVDEFGDPVLGANVIIVGTTVGVTTDFDGNFTLKDVPEKGQLRITFIGYAQQIVSVAGKSQISVTLKEDVAQLEDVVVVGYGMMKKSDLTGSVSSVGTDKLNAKGAPSLMESLQGATPGVNISMPTGRLGGTPTIEIRGKSSINSNTTPLFVVDGVICDDIDWLNPQDIERIDVQKDASSTAIYGSRASAGVVMVTTKGGMNVKRESKANINYEGYYGWSKVARMPEFMNGEQWYQYRFLKFTSSVAAPLVNNSQFAYGMSKSALEQCLIWDGTEFQVKEMLKSGNTYDWPDLLTQDGAQQNHYLSVSGSSEKVKYHVGVGFNDQEGMYKKDGHTRVNFKGSLDAKVNNLVSVGFNINMARTDRTFAADEAIDKGFRMNPYMSPYYVRETVYGDNNHVYQPGDLSVFTGNMYTLGTANTTKYQFSDVFNPLASMLNSTQEGEGWRMLGNMFVQLDFTKELSFKTTFSPNFRYYRQGYYEGYEDPNNPGHVFAVTTKSPYIQVPMTDDYVWSTASYETSRTFQFTWDNVINWNHTFAKDHSVSAMALYSMESYNRDRAYWKGSNTEVVGTDWWAMQNLTHNASDSYTRYTENSMISTAVRANYSYKGKYMVTGTARWDGSSKFAKEHRWGTFQSGAVAWRLSQEDFMKSYDWITNLKLRASYGVTGNNSGVGDYETRVSIGRVGTYPINGSYSTGFLTNITDPSLSWETSKEVDFGLDFGFLRDRITGSIDWYNKTSDDLLFSVNLPMETGSDASGKLTSVTTNVGSVRNRGLELAMTGVVIDDHGWNWTLTANWSKNYNKILEINGVSDSYKPATASDQVTKSLFVGRSYGVIWAYKDEGAVTDRMIRVPNNLAATSNGFTPGEKVKEYEYYYKVYGLHEGEAKVADTNGDGKITTDDRQFFETAPKWSGTITSNLSYRGWDMNFSVFAKIGQYSYSSFLGGDYVNYADRGRQKLQIDYYIPAGALIDCDGINEDGTYINPKYQESTHYGHYPFPNNAGVSSGLGNHATYWDEARAVVKTSFVKVKNITLGYTFPKKWLTPWHCQNLRLYCTVTNPFVFTDYLGFDPEWASASTKDDGPSAVTYQIGASVKF